MPVAVAERGVYWAHYRHRQLHQADWVGTELVIDGKTIHRTRLIKNVAMLLESDVDGPVALQERIRKGDPWRSVLLSILVGMGEIRNGREMRFPAHHGLPPFSIDAFIPDFLRG
jgi:hypothetical protein